MKKKKNMRQEERYILSEKELLTIQRIELEMLLEIDRICTKNGISYELDGGTLLGAVRHKGYIPWDDDIDLRMLRKDYDKFCDACKTDLDTSKFFWQTYNTDPGYRFGYGKLVRKGTVFKRLHHEMLDYKKGVFLDIMPCDNLPDQWLKKTIYNFECFVIRKISYSPIGAKYEPNIILKLIYMLLSLLPKTIIQKGFDRLAYQYDDEKTEMVRTTGWHDKKEARGYKRSWMDDVCELEFEGHMFPAPADWDGYLKQLYGSDYMTLPPESERIPKTFITQFSYGEQ